MYMLMRNRRSHLKRLEMIGNALNVDLRKIFLLKKQILKKNNLDFFIEKTIIYKNRNI